MFLVHIYYISLSILQILYVTGVSVSWNSPSTIYSSISSKSVPLYNGHLQQESSTIQPFEISGGTSTSLKKNQINNLNTEISSNRGLELNTNKILVSQDSQLGNNNDDSVSEYTITNNQPSEVSGGSSQSSSKITNIKIPVQVTGPELSNIYHGINKNIETSHSNDVIKLYESSGDNRGFQLGELGILTGSISENGTNISGGEERGGETFSGSVGSLRFDRINDGKIGGSGGKKEEGKRFSGLNGSIRFSRQGEEGAGGSGGEEEAGIRFSGSNGSIRFDGKSGGLGGFSGEEERGRRFSGSNGSIRFNGRSGGSGGSNGEEEGGIRFSGSNGSIRFDGRSGESGGSNREEEGGRRFSGSNGSIRFNGRSGGSGGSNEEEEGGRRFSGSNGSIRFNGRAGGSGGSNREEEGGRRFSGSNGSIRFDGRSGGSGGSNEEEEGGRRFSGSNGSIRFNGRAGGSGGSNGEEGGIRFSGSNGSIKFDSRSDGSGDEERRGRKSCGSVGFIRIGRNNNNKVSGSVWNEKGNRGFSGSKGSIRFNRRNKSRASGSGGKIKGSRGFNESFRSIQFGRTNEGITGGSGEENKKVSVGHRARRLSRSKDNGKVTGFGEKRNFGELVGGIQFDKENGDKDLNKSNSVNIKITGGNYGGRKFDGFTENNGFIREYGTGEERFGEYNSLGNNIS